MSPQEITEFKRFLKEQEEDLLCGMENVVGRMYIKGVFTSLQTELEIKFMEEDLKMAKHFGEDK